MRKSARTQIPPFFDNDPYSVVSHLVKYPKVVKVNKFRSIALANNCKLTRLFVNRYRPQISQQSNYWY